MSALRPPATLATVVLLALLGAGCGSDAPSATDTGTAGSTGTARSTAKEPATAQEKAVRFAQCMRKNGVGDFPDPDASGELTLDGVLNGSSLDSDGATWKAAVAACKDLEPSGFTGRTRTGSRQQAALRFAQCIRDNGVTDFPDPTPDAPLVDTNRIPSTRRSGGMSILNAAMRTCGDAFGDRLGVTRP
jgi:hypothetical protein